MKVMWLGRISYEEGLALQITHRDEVLAGGAEIHRG